MRVTVTFDNMGARTLGANVSAQALRRVFKHKEVGRMDEPARTGVCERVSRVIVGCGHQYRHVPGGCSSDSNPWARRRRLCRPGGIGQALFCVLAPIIWGTSSGAIRGATVGLKAVLFVAQSRNNFLG